ncbi:MAG: polysaccharide pyruvyl transferase family protein [Defluviicoccus sp.]|nr:MAG: polysaccharide pyruvyl transferase family protein [Defluviicoccus sp.]
MASNSNSRIFAYGAFGSNNVGDEAILEGIRKIYPECIQIYHNKVRNGIGYLPGQLLDGRISFKENDYLIIGGGGLLYDRTTVIIMTNLAKKARAAGATVDILRLGCEAAAPEYEKEIADLFRLARRASVRSTASQRIMNRIMAETFSVEFDFAFNLDNDVEAMPRRKRKQHEILTIGIVTASIDKQELNIFSDLIHQRINRSCANPVRFIHIPHSRSYFNPSNNDCVTGHMLWSLSRTHNAINDDMLIIEPFDGEPRSVLSKYKQLDGVISSRYHGLIFGKLAKIPTLAIGSTQIKIASFIEDHASEMLFRQ